MSVLYVVAPWDSREVDSPLLNTYFQGVYTDYNMMWFRDIGNTIAQTMFLNMFSPVIETFAFTFLRFGFRCADQGRLCVRCRNSDPNSFNTKKTTV